MRKQDRGTPLAASSTLNRLQLGLPESATSDRYKRIAADSDAMDERLAKPSSREALLQISCSVCSEVSKEIDLRNAEERNMRDIEGVMS